MTTPCNELKYDRFAEADNKFTEIRRTDGTPTYIHT